MTVVPACTRVATALDAAERVLETPLDGLCVCELARLEPDGRARVTVTSEEFLALDTDDVAILAP
jgi:hypothetical protein